MAFSLQSPVFAAGQSIPQKYTCGGEQTSPPLTWTDLPAGTRSLALILEDPDAPNGTFTHWVAYNIDPAQDGLPEGVSDREPGLMTGKNSTGQYGYSPPARPPAPTGIFSGSMPSTTSCPCRPASHGTCWNAPSRRTASARPN